MSVLNGYQKSWLRGDVIAGVTVAAIAIPESLGYAKIAGLPIQTGLYCALLPALMFALIGSSRQLVVGADSATAALVAAGAGLVAAQGTAEYASAVGVLAILTAVFLLLFAVARLEFLADLISQPVLAGFLSGVGVSLIIGNLSGMLGVPASGSTWDKLTQTLSELDQANWTTAALAFGTVIVMLVLEERMPKLPAALVSLTLFSVIAVVIDAAASGVDSVGAIPAGLPGFTIPDFQTGEFATLAASAFSIAVVILAQSAAVARSFAQKNGYTDSVKGDLVGLSAANLASAFTSGFAINGSPPRTAAGDSSGSKGQVVNIAMAVTVALVLLFLTGLFEYIPSGVLDAVVFTIGIKLVKVGTLRAVGRTSRPEFLVAIVTLLAVAFVGVEQGIFLAIILSLIDRLRRQYHPADDVLLSDGKVIPRLETRVKVPAHELDDVLVYRFNAPLFFENATFFGERVRAEMAATATPVKVLVIDAAAMPDIDYTGAQTLADLGRELRGTGAELVLTEVSDAILHRIATTGIDADLTVIPRLEDAVHVRPAQRAPTAEAPGA
jgi:sulfate permease, SulP family